MVYAMYYNVKISQPLCVIFHHQDTPWYLSPCLLVNGLLALQVHVLGGEAPVSTWGEVSPLFFFESAERLLCQSYQVRIFLASTMTKWSLAKLCHQGEDGESFLGVSWFPQMWLGWDRKRLVLEIRWWNHPFENCNLAKCDHCHPRRWRYVVLGLALLSRARPSVGGRRRLWFNRLPMIIISVLIFFTIVIVPSSSKCYALDINVFLLPTILAIKIMTTSAGTWGKVFP